MGGDRGSGSGAWWDRVGRGRQGSRVRRRRSGLRGASARCRLPTGSSAAGAAAEVAGRPRRGIPSCWRISKRLVEPDGLVATRSLLRSGPRKSVRHLTAKLHAMGHAASHTLVAQLLHSSGFSLQANRKTREASQHPDRDAQFHYLNDQVRLFHERGQPSAIPVDTRRSRSWRVLQEPRTGAGLRQGRALSRVVAGRLPYSRPGQGRPLRRVRPAPQRGLGVECRDRPPRHWASSRRQRIDGGGRAHWSWRVSRCAVAADHGRCGRQQRSACAAVEVGAAAVCEPHRSE